MPHTYRKGLALLLATALTALGLATVSCTTSRAQTSANVTVDATTSLGAIPPMAYGVNTAVWDGLMTDPKAFPLLRQIDTTALRYPGGSTSDEYHWQTNTTGNGRQQPADHDFDHFMRMVKAVGVKPIITIDYGSNAADTAGGDPSEAAAWVRYANVTHHYGVKYWEIGNEVYGNGFYGGRWERDLHYTGSDRKGEPALGPTAYGKNVLQFVKLMKAQDPTIKVGAVLCAPGCWPDAQSPDWNSNVLSQCGQSIDFVIVHWYPQDPGKESDPGLLNSPSTIPGMVASLRSLIKQYCGDNAPNVQIMLTETNSVSSNPGKQTLSVVNALFIADEYMTWLESGVNNVDIWALHNGVSNGNESPSLYGSATYGDYGILSNGGMEPPAETPWPSYDALQMLTHLGKPGDTMVSSTSSNSLLAVHAVKQANGKLALLLINKDPANSCAAYVSLTGFTPAASAATYSYGAGSGPAAPPSATVGETFSITLPPYSLTTVVASPGGP